MFSKKKATLEDLLGELSAAKQTLDNENRTLDNIAYRYTDVYSDYLRYKQGYETALAAYTRHGGAAYAQKEYEARILFSNASKKLSTITTNYNASQKRVSKAKKVCQKLQNLVKARQESEQMGG